MRLAATARRAARPALPPALISSGRSSVIEMPPLVTTMPYAYEPGRMNR